MQRQLGSTGEAALREVRYLDHLIPSGFTLGGRPYRVFTFDSFHDGKVLLHRVRLAQEAAGSLPVLLHVLYEASRCWSSTRDEGGGWLGLAKPVHCVFHHWPSQRSGFMERGRVVEGHTEEANTPLWAGLSIGE